MGKILRGFVFALAMWVFPGLSAFAAENGDAADAGSIANGYTYTVTLSAGEHAKFDDGTDVKVYENLKLEDNTLSFADALDQLRDYLEEEGSKYYVRGVRLSGQETMREAPVVDRDAIYVVSYGIRGNMVDYTVNYVDAEGRELAEPRVLRGNVGDKPVVAYLYIEGYQPQAYNLTRTLRDDPDQNQFTFVYTPVTASGPEGGGTGTGGGGTGETIVNIVDVPVDVPVGPAVVGGAAQGGAAQGGEPTPGGEGEQGGEPAPGGEGEQGGEVAPPAPVEPDAEVQTTPEGPQEVIDLDDEELPLADFNGDENAGSTEKEPSAKLWFIGIGSGIVVILAAAWFLIKGKRKKAEAKEEE